MLLFSTRCIVLNRFLFVFVSCEIYRDLDEILPENYSNSYQSVVQHIFPDDTSVREYTVLNPTKESVQERGGLYDLLTQVNMTRDSIDEDEDYLSMNFTAVGCILLKFTNELSKEMVSSLTTRAFILASIVYFCF